MLGIRLATMVLAVAGTAAATGWMQTDWSRGGGDAGPSGDWRDGFASSSGLSWLAIPGQLALSSTALAEPVEHLLFDHHPRVYGLCPVDMDDDGRTDIVATTDSGGIVAIWFNRGGDPVTWEEEVIDSDFPGGTGVVPVDVDGDGDLDLVGSAQTPGDRLAWWRNDGDAWVRLDIDRMPVACNIGTADLDGDGTPDVIATSWSGNEIAWWSNEGGDPVVWTKHTIANGFRGGHSSLAADVDGDGDLDLVGTAAQSSCVVLFLNDGGEPLSWTPQTLTSSMEGVRYATFGDLDGDGDLDVVATAFDGQLVWFANDGGRPPGWTAHLVDDTCTGGHWVNVADLDGDGSNDILVAPSSEHAIFWYANDGGSPVEWTRHDLGEAFPMPLTAVPIDVDGDGDLDVVGASWYTGEVRWWEITEFVQSGELVSTVLDLGDGGGRNVPLHWRATVPLGATLDVQLRTAPVDDDLGPWATRLTEPSSVFVDRYVQYRVVLGTSDSRVSPLLYQLELAMPRELAHDSDRVEAPVTE